MAERADRLPRSGFQPSPSAGELAGRIARREICAVDAVGDAFERIARLDGALAAFCTLDEAQALSDAAAIDARIHRGEAVGALAGVPVAIKDLISTRGLRTTFGSPLWPMLVQEKPLGHSGF